MERVSQYAAQIGLEVEIVLPQPLEQLGLTGMSRHTWKAFLFYYLCLCCYQVSCILRHRVLSNNLISEMETHKATYYCRDSDETEVHKGKKD